MQVRALKSFAGKYGHIRVGQRFNCEPHYATDLIRNGLVELAGDDKPAPADPGPAANRSIPEAPQRANTPAPKAPAGKDGATADSGRTPAAGEATASRSLRQDLASRPRTSRRSGRGETPSSSQESPPDA